MGTQKKGNPRIRMLDQSLLGFEKQSKEQLGLLHAEVREFLSRYEHLNYQVDPGRADAEQVAWSVVTRFFVPWLAFRIAFWLRDSKELEPEAAGYWFVPMKGTTVRSSFMSVVDGFVRKSGESEDALARRLCLAATGVDREDVAESLGRDFRRYRSFEGTASDGTIDQIVKGSAATSHLLIMLVLARAVDRNVQYALRFFGHRPGLRLFRWFALCFRHFVSLLRKLGSALPKEQEWAWLFWQSQTIMGNTPVEADRFYPLMDPFMSELARKITSELDRTTPAGKLARLPRTPGDLQGGSWPEVASASLPIPIEEQLGKRDFCGTVRESQFLFGQQVDLHEAERVGSLLCNLAHASWDPALPTSPMLPSHDAALQLFREGTRLLELALDHATSNQKPRIAIQLLRLLLEAHRPKTVTERKLARRLFRLADNYHRLNRREGASAYLLGCLLWLEDKEREAVQAFSRARELGKESCGPDWVWLLRIAPVLAERVSRREFKRFMKLAELYGVFSSQPFPRTGLVTSQMAYPNSRTPGSHRSSPFPFEAPLRRPPLLSRIPLGFRWHKARAVCLSSICLAACWSTLKSPTIRSVTSTTRILLLTTLRA
jgi:hypothetical protein